MGQTPVASPLQFVIELLPTLLRSLHLHLPVALTEGSLTTNLNKTGVRLWTQSSLVATLVELCGLVKKKKGPQERTFDLANKRGTRLAQGPCNRCGLVRKPVWRYRDSAFDEILLCSECKTAVFDESRKKIDALNWSTGGGFESNRRRH